MIPENVEQFTTEGEGKAYRFFKKVAVPDNKYQIWYTPDINDKEPDFILFCNKIGLIVFEVKDWDLSQILEADQQYFKLYMGGKTATRTNPLKQAKGYIFSLMDKIEEDGNLLSKDPLYYGKPAIPMNYGVIFPNINKYEYVEKELNKIIKTDKIFFWDDLHPQSEIQSDNSGQLFYETLQNMFKPLFQFNINYSELNHLKQMIFPVVKIELPQRDTNEQYLKQIRHLKVLDSNQESIARKFDGGHRIITGPSGCGKTLVLVHKAAFLKKYNPHIKKILFVCYNITLVHYIKRLLAAKNVPMGETGVKVVHIYQLCSEIIDEEVAYENEDAEYYELIIQETLDKLQNYDKRYDAVLVDEGQDMSGNMFRILTTLLNKQTNNLTIALDDNQNIYKHKYSWKDAGVQVQVRVHKISYVYRNTKEICIFASTFIKTTIEKKDQQIELFPDFGVLRGPYPEIKQFKNYDDIMKYIVAETKVLKEKGFPFSETAIIYSRKSPKNDPNIVLPQMVEKYLDENGILHNWTSENYQSKKTYDVTTNSVTISTIHSVKGFDYSSVFLLGMDSLKPGRWTESQINRLVYVAITRARHRLFIPYIIETALIRQLKECL